MASLRRWCGRLGVTLCGGHTEVTDSVTKPVAVGQMVGTATRSRLVDESRMRPGDQILLTKALAVEGTAILAREFRPALESLGLPADEVSRCEQFLFSPGISVLEEAETVLESGGVSALHDVTEGGAATALDELTRAGRHRIRVRAERIPVFPETARICRLLGIDPLGLIGSGSLLIVCRADSRQRLEEAIKRDHRVLGEKLDLFIIDSMVGKGLPLWLPDGATLRDTLERWLRDIQIERGYLPVVTPHLGNIELYKTSGHYPYYADSQYTPIDVDGDEFLLRPMNCPHHCRIYTSQPRSYRDLPLRYAEFGTVYRYEQSGELRGLTRVRGFTVDDAHLFVRPDQLLEEFQGVVKLIQHVFNALGMTAFRARLGTRDPDSDKYVGDNSLWEEATVAIINACEDLGMDYHIEPGEAAFYGPKLDFIVRDVLKREWQLGTVQVDYNLPQRFDLEYVDRDNERKRPVMIHRAPFGSL